MKLSDTQLFRGIEEDEIPHLLTCLQPRERSYQKGEVIFAEGTYTEELAMLLSGRVIISFDDWWGNRSILGNIEPGSVFAEVYACIPSQALLVSAFAAEDTSVLFLHVGRMLRTCSASCHFHTKLTQNLLMICAQKNLGLSQRMQDTSSKTIRGRLLSYLSAYAKEAGGDEFRIPYNRQQLADYLSVDRSTMCNEMSKMQKEGLISYHKNHFILLR